MVSVDSGNAGPAARSTGGTGQAVRADARAPVLWGSVPTISLQQISPAMRTATFQLPPDIDDFTGRDDALRTLRSILSSGDGRASAAVSAITGQAGVGKTALATKVAHELRALFPDGQLYVNLRGTEAQRLKSSDVLGEFLLELGVARAAIPERLAQRAAQYRARLATRRVLVVLDNAADEAQVRPLLPSTPGSAALVTSRARLGGLEHADPLVLDVLERDQAVELLAKVVGAERVTAEPAAAEAIVELCGRLPLAIRVVAAKAAATGRAPLATLAGHLADEHGRLAELRLRDPEVRASFALNYENLHEDERHAFRLLGLLRSPDFSAWVAAALLDCELHEGEGLVGRLVDAQVLEVAHRTANGQVRFRFHDLLRIFARERLSAEEPPEVQDAALQRALHAYLGLARHAAALLEPGEPDQDGPPTSAVGRLSGVAERIAADPAAWFEGERMSLLAAIDQASDNDLREVTWELARSLTYFLKVRTHWSDWQYTQRLALKATRRARNRAAMANVLRSLGDAEAHLGRFRNAVTHFEQALALFPALADPRGEAWTLFGLGYVNHEQGSFDAAVARFEAGMRLFRRVGDQRGEAWTLEGRGLVHRNQGKYEEASACFERGLALFRRVGDRRGEAYCLVNLGIVQRSKGQFDTALRSFDQARPIFEELADQHGTTYVKLNIGHMLREQGHYDEAIETLLACLAVFQRVGERAGEAWTRFNLGMIHEAVRRPEEAVAEFDRCQALFERLGDVRGAAWTSIGLARVLLARGAVGEAVARFAGAVTVFRQIDDQLGLATALSGQGEALAADGRRLEADEKWHEAVAILHRLGASDASKVAARLAVPGEGDGSGRRRTH